MTELPAREHARLKTQIIEALQHNRTETALALMQTETTGLFEAVRIQTRQIYETTSLGIGTKSPEPNDAVLYLNGMKLLTDFYGISSKIYRQWAKQQ